MSIYITGDIHGYPKRLSNKSLKLFRLEISERDKVIICGDFGLPWCNDKEDEYWLNWLEEKNFEILFVDGNHENFDLLYQFPVVERYGGKVHKVRKNIFHLMRGEVYEIEGKTFFAFGGASSVDKHLRVESISWWKQENFSLCEFDNAVNNLKKVDFKVDYVITHTAPKRFIIDYQKETFNVDTCPTSQMLSKLEKMLMYQKWFFGHFHVDYCVNESVAAWMYRRIVKVDE